MTTESSRIDEAAIIFALIAGNFVVGLSIAAIFIGWSVASVASMPPINLIAVQPIVSCCARIGVGNDGQAKALQPYQNS